MAVLYQILFSVNLNKILMLKQSNQSIDLFNKTISNIQYSNFIIIWNNEINDAHFVSNQIKQINDRMYIKLSIIWIPSPQSRPPLSNKNNKSCTLYTYCTPVATTATIIVNKIMCLFMWNIHYYYNGSLSLFLSLLRPLNCLFLLEIK